MKDKSMLTQIVDDIHIHSDGNATLLTIIDSRSRNDLTSLCYYYGLQQNQMIEKLIMLGTISLTSSMEPKDVKLYYEKKLIREEEGCT